MARTTALIALTTLAASHLMGCNVVETDTDVDQEMLCVDRQADMELNFSVATDWPTQGDIGTERLEINATCVVVSADATAIDLTCTDAAITDGNITIALTETPVGFEHRIVAGQQITLDHQWHGDGHHLSSGKFVALRDGSDGRALLLLLDGYTQAVSDVVDDMTLTHHRDTCENPCSPGGHCSDPHRLGLALTENGPSVLDGNHEEIIIAARSYDLFVARAESYSCLNCGGELNVAIVAAD